MKKRLIPLAVLLAVISNARSQSTFQYDQQSYIAPIPPSTLFDIQPNGPVGQSFTPALSSVGFVQFELFDGLPNNSAGATLYINLRSNSITGPILSSSTLVFLPDNFGGVTNFIFSTPAAVVPGTAYFFQVLVQSGDTWRINVSGNAYAGGTFIYQGNAQPVEDAWFREGIVIPEPCAVSLGLISLAACAYVGRLRKTRRSG